MGWFTPPQGSRGGEVQLLHCRFANNSQPLGQALRLGQECLFSRLRVLTMLHTTCRFAKHIGVPSETNVCEELQPVRSWPPPYSYLHYA